MKPKAQEGSPNEYGHRCIPGLEQFRWKGSSAASDSRSPWQSESSHFLAIPDPAPVLADQAKFYLECPTTEVREGDSVDVFLIRVANHQHSVTFGAYWRTDAGTAGTSDYVHQDTGAIWGSESERLANRAKRTFRTREDSLIEGNETFTARFSPVDIVVDRNNPDRDEKCEITIIDDDPNITDVEVTSSPARDDTYGVGETIEISATFSTDVEVDGDPGLGLWVGSNWRAAGYLRGSGSDTLVFGYTVKADDSDSDGIKMDGGYQDNNDRWHNFLNHTAVTAVDSDTVACRFYSGIDNQSGHKVDGSLAPAGTNTEITSSPASGTEVAYQPNPGGATPTMGEDSNHKVNGSIVAADTTSPTVSSVSFADSPGPGDDSTYGAGDWIGVWVTFSESVLVTGTPQVELNIGSTTRTAQYGHLAGGGTLDPNVAGIANATVAFGYTVQEGDSDTDGISIGASRLTLNGGAIEDEAGNDAVLTHDAVSDDSGHKVGRRRAYRVVGDHNFRRGG